MESIALAVAFNFLRRFSNTNLSSKSSRDPWSSGVSVSRDPDPLSSAASFHRDVTSTRMEATAASHVAGMAGHASPDANGLSMARPGIKLEALPPRSTTAKRRKNKKPNALEPL